MRKVIARWPAIGLALTACALAFAVPGALGAAGDREVSVGSPSTPFSQNKQNEPAMAVDANHPNVLAAGANDNIDLEACNAGDPTTCPFTAGVGVSGIYFSFDNGVHWTQPTYTGWTARHCLGPAACEPHFGPIGTLPWYFENGLVSDGDPALAFGPRRGANGTFSWANGSRLYYANLTSNFGATKKDETFKGFEAIYVSRTDDPQSAAAGNKAAWLQPVRVSKQSSATFADKEQIWADNAASSPFFGNVYVCWQNFVGGGAAPLVVASSRNGGDTWSETKVTAAHNVSARHFGQSGCTVRTDSSGVVYVFYEEFQNPLKVGVPPSGTHFLVKSFDGGQTWTKPMALYRIVDPCFNLSNDGSILRCVEDGIAGARNDLSASPSVDIANGAPTGADATNEIVNAWADGRDGLNHEHVMFASSNSPNPATRGNPGTWTAPRSIETAGDRGYYAAPAISPNGSTVYVVYNAFTNPYRNDTTSPRGLVGVVEQASVGGGGTVGAFAPVHRGAQGDPRGSSQNNLVLEFLGDYVYAVATRAYGAAVWNDVREAADCPAIDAFRYSFQTGGSVPRPAPGTQCPPTFGNSDIWGWTSG
jgi:hypothetical protein